MSAEYADQLTKKDRQERLDREPVGTGPFQLAEGIRIDVEQAIVELCGQRIDNQAAPRFLRIKNINLPADAVDETTITDIRRHSAIGRSMNCWA